MTMEIALHIRRLSEANQIDAIGSHLKKFHAGELTDADRLPSAGRIYVGDEFCPLRLPGTNTMERYCRFSQTSKLGLTLLTPVLTDLWLDRCRPLFDGLARWIPSAEVVVNDLGTLLYLKRHHPRLALSMGRLFNKGFKDPRLAKNRERLTPEIEALLSESTFDHPEFTSILTGFNLSRVERDLMPHAGYLPHDDTSHDTSYYFPYGYVTTGRVCWTATFAKDGIEDYKPIYQCARPCGGLKFQLDDDTISLIQSGNTIFYRYSPDAMSALMNRAMKNENRLVYQGLSL